MCTSKRIMRCIIPTCDLDSNYSTGDVTFHSIPSKPSVRAVWLKVLNMEPSEVEKDSAVCSKHFLKGDLYVNKRGACRMRSGALPIINVQNIPTSDSNDLKVCRVCFATDCKLYKMTDNNNLHQAYNVLTGLSLENEENLPPYLCYECAQRLVNCVQFRTRSLRAHLVLLDVVKKHESITLQSIKSVIGTDSNLGSNLKVTQTDHYDVKTYYIKKEDEETEERVDLTDNIVDVKKEKDDAMLEDEEIHDDVTDLHEHYDIKVDTDDSISQDVTDEDMPNDNSKYLTEDEDGVNILVANKAVDDDGLTDTIVKDVGKDGGKNVVLMVKRRRKGLLNNVELLQAKGKSRQCPQRHYCQLLGDRLIIKSSTTKYSRAAEELCPTNIVKLRKRVAVEKVPPKIPQDKFPYQTVNDIPQWCRLKTHTAIKPFSCSLCGFKTGYKKELEVHGRTHCSSKCHENTQSGSKTVSCGVCKQVFMNKNHLYKHIDIMSGGKPYSCDICKEQFRYEFELDIHNRIHNGEKQYSCGLCKKEFQFETSLTLHTRRLHPHENVKKIQLDGRMRKGRKVVTGDKVL